MPPDKSVLEIIKQKDEYKYVVEITTENSQFKPQIKVLVRSDESDIKATAEVARAAYEETQNKLDEYAKTRSEKK